MINATISRAAVIAQTGLVCALLLVGGGSVGIQYSHGIISRAASMMALAVYLSAPTMR